MKISKNIELQLITLDLEELTHTEQVRQACEAGATWVQFRSKTLSFEQKLEECIQIRAITKEYKCVFIVNDSVTLAAKVKADGVHLGQKDLHPMRARNTLGTKKKVGLTINSLEQAQVLKKEISTKLTSVDYVGVGPFKATTTKENHSEPLSIEDYKGICKELEGIPAVGIGSVLATDISELLSYGLSGVAVASGVFKGDITQNLKTYLEVIKEEGLKLGSENMDESFTFDLEAKKKSEV
jgi:thiamine-phosphate pyrophosphorylase